MRFNDISWVMDIFLASFQFAQQIRVKNEAKHFFVVEKIESKREIEHELYF